MEKELAIESIKSGEIRENFNLIFDLETGGYSLINRDVNTKKRVALISDKVAKAYVSKYLDYKIADADLAHYLPKYQTIYTPKKPFGAISDIDFNVHHEPKTSNPANFHDDFNNLFLNIFEDAKGVEYALNWIANMVQGNKNETAIVLYGIEGSGKGTFYSLIEKMLGSTNVLIASNQTLESNFNEELAYKRFFGVNEMGSHFNNQKTMNSLKTYITDDFILIYPKNRTPYRVDNFTNTVIATNSHNAVKVTPTDRRFNVFHQKRSLKEIDVDLSSRLHKLIGSDEVMRLKQFFLDLDLTNWDSRTPFANETRRRMMMTTATKKEWLIHIIKDQNGRATKDIYFDDVLNISDSNDLDFDVLANDDTFQKVMAQTEYAKHSPKVTDVMIRQDFELLHLKGILTSRYAVLLYRVVTDDLRASTTTIGRFYGGFFDKSKMFNVAGTRVRGYKTR